jgi:peptidoglycan/LPS O-acetylase OafA/YrhL
MPSPAPPATAASVPIEPAPTTGLVDQHERARRLRSVDALRGIAALAVVLTHLPRDHGGVTDWTFLAFLPFDFGTLGVPLFLVISGFCIHLAVARRATAGQRVSVDWAAFWKRRFYRLYPPYVAAIVFSLSAYALLSWFGRLPPGSALHSPWLDITTHLLLVHNLLPAFSDGLFNPAFWTLALEEQLYAMFALLLFLRRRVTIARVLVISFVVALVWRTGVTLIQFVLAREAGLPRDAQQIAFGSLPAIGNWSIWPFAWWFLWVLGAVAAEGCTRSVALPAWCYSRATAAAMAVLGASTYFRTLGRYTEFWLTDAGAEGWLRVALNTLGGFSELAFGVCFFVVLNRWVRAEQDGRFEGRWVTTLTWVGVFSYSLYLVHFPTIAVLEAWLPLGARSSVPAFLLRMIIYVPVCIAVGYVFFMTIERHFLKHRKGTWRSWAQARHVIRWRQGMVTR